MSYVENNLLKDEKIVYKANIHWFIYMTSILLFIAGILYSMVPNTPVAAGFNLIVLSFLAFLYAFINRKTTELAITSKRVIAKYGLIKRNTVELNHNKIESYHVDQGIMGRIFNFGTIVINGTGGGKTSLSRIDEPLKFRKYAMEVMDHI